MGLDYQHLYVFSVRYVSSSECIASALHQRHYHTRLSVHQSSDLLQTHIDAVKEAM